ncbi:Hypothetical predicted protein [Paramuricea clavata]|uniref:Uncharacterized protein n=1 Tax=Paramuricea clavata TaxID=317549 RepID=A0A7D9DAY9_PARCT|nr:Hypothetical predicted protein [Paramuricea clavata]
MPDISKSEQVSLCPRYVCAGETVETFVGFSTTASTEGEVLFELVKKVILNLELKLENIVGECFDGAANMSGVRKGLATRMKELLSFGSIRPLFNDIYRVSSQCLWNVTETNTFLEASPKRPQIFQDLEIEDHINLTLKSLSATRWSCPKRHQIFQDLEIEDHINLTLKSLSATRWSCRWEAVRAVVEQITRIVQALISCSDDRDPTTYTDSNALLNSICDFNFVFGLLLLRVVLSNTDSLSKYLQSKNMDVTTAKKTADSTIKTLEGCRNEEGFQML